MPSARLIILSACVVALAGCSQMHSSVSRGHNGMSFAASGGDQQQQMLEQAQALDAMTRELVRRTTMQGAAIGAAAGCGLVLLSASESGNCLAGALAGGALGAVVGNASGKRQVAERVEIVSLSRITPTLSDAQKQMALMAGNMDAFLESQDHQIASLTEQRDSGRISQEKFDRQMNHIRATRAELAQALTLSAEQAHVAKEALKQAGAQGQTGLDWHIMSAGTLEDEAVSARSRISLL